MRIIWILYLSFFLLIFAGLTIQVPVRTIVDADYESDKSFPLRSASDSPAQGSPKQKKVKKRARGQPPMSREEKLRIDRERKRKAYRMNTEHYKELHHKAYIKRKNDPEKRAHDSVRRKIYKQQNRLRIAEDQRMYYYRRKAKIEEKQRQEEEKSTTLQKDAKKDVADFHHNTRVALKYPRTSPNTQTQHRPVVARLKLSEKTIESFYGTGSPPS